MSEPLSKEAFVARLREEGGRRYHDAHPFHRAMHAGGLSRVHLQAWVANRYYYQTRIPIKDALILAKSENPAFRRAWIHRLTDHDGKTDEDGGLALWRRLGRAVGLRDADLASHRYLLRGVRFACDAYVSLIERASLAEAVASSLTELFAPDLLTQRIQAWQRHYPFVDGAALAYFKSRVPRAASDAAEALELVVGEARSAEMQERCVAALVRKTEILWHLLDCIVAAHPL